MLRTGDRVCHRFKRSLGPGVVVRADDRMLVVEFPDAGERLSFAGDTDALTQLVIAPGARLRTMDGGEEVVVDQLLEDGLCRLEDGREMLANFLWPLPGDDSPIAKASS
jgi:hypothetical protein